MHLTTHSEIETMQLAEQIAQYSRKGTILCLEGELGTGKTTFVKGLANGLNIKADVVQSPTFTLMNIYEGKLPIYHFDLYRLDDQLEISLIGYEEFLYGDGIAVIEWAEKLQNLCPEEYLKIQFKHLKHSSRSIQITPKGSKYRQLVEKLNQENSAPNCGAS